MTLATSLLTRLLSYLPPRLWQPLASRSSSRILSHLSSRLSSRVSSSHIHRHTSGHVCCHVFGQVLCDVCRNNSAPVSRHHFQHISHHVSRRASRHNAVTSPVLPFVVCIMSLATTLPAFRVSSRLRDRKMCPTPSESHSAHPKGFTLRSHQDVNQPYPQIPDFSAGFGKTMPTAPWGWQRRHHDDTTATNIILRQHNEILHHPDVDSIMAPPHPRTILQHRSDSWSSSVDSTMTLRAA